MKNQITVSEVRAIIRITRDLAPILNREEMTKIIVLYNQVLDRYTKEEYPDRLPEEIAE